MKITPPIRRPEAANRSARYLTALWLVVAVFCGWQLAGLPGALVRKYDPPVDMPWYSFGPQQVAVDEQGIWHVARQGYADRATYLVLEPGDKPRKFSSIPPQLYLLDRSGSLGQQSVAFAGGQLAIKASRQYWAWRWRLKNLADSADERKVAYLADGSEDVAGPALPMEPHVALVHSAPDRRVYLVLEGNQHYRVFDGAAALTPNVWVTTERGRNIHRLVYRETDGAGRFELVQSSPTQLEADLEHGAVLGALADDGLVYMLLPSGQVDYYDAVSLAFIRSEQLAGDWRREQAALLHFGAGYSFYQGLPLSEAGYLRLMRGLMLVFLLSLLALVVSWSSGCTSISDRTTADTTPSSS